MNKNHILFPVMLVFLSACQLKNHDSASSNETSDTEQWTYLFNGRNLDGWRSFQSDTAKGWIVENSCLTATGEGGDLGGDIITTEMYDNFILELDWKISPGGNSGILFHVLEEGHNTTYETGPEYQLIDDKGYPDPLETWQLTAANYAMHPAGDNKVLMPAGEFNHTKIVVDSARVEHWLNGEKVVEYELWTPEWEALKMEGKWKNYPDYGMAEFG